MFKCLLLENAMSSLLMGGFLGVGPFIVLQDSEILIFRYSFMLLLFFLFYFSSIINEHAFFF